MHPSASSRGFKTTASCPKRSRPFLTHIGSRCVNLGGDFWEEEVVEEEGKRGGLLDI